MKIEDTKKYLKKIKYIFTVIGVKINYWNY